MKYRGHSVIDSENMEFFCGTYFFKNNSYNICTYVESINYI
jgi:hypothetical protein